MTELLDGRLVSDLILQDLTTKIEKLRTSTTALPKLAVILVGENPASLSYIKQKQMSAEKVGIVFELISMPEKITQQDLIAKIEQINQDNSIHGLIVQLPLPQHISTPEVIKVISPRKDVDGFQAYNLGKMFLSSEYEELAPCTPKGIIKLLEHYNINVKGTEITIVGHSNIVGKPMATMLLNRDATVTVCHKETKDLKKHTLNADILIVAVGKPNLIRPDMIKKGTVIIDVGCTKVEDKLCGDVDFEGVQGIAGYVSPVPGGVGPLTVACLLENTYIAYRWLLKNKFKLCAEL